MYKGLSRLNRNELQNLRNDVVLLSLYERDYKNRYDLDPKTVMIFFDGYGSYLDSIMKEEGVSDSEFYDKLHKFDTIDNLLAWHKMVYIR